MHCCPSAPSNRANSGLGLEAQRRAIRDYLDGGKWWLIGEYVEVESGKRSVNRPQLREALDRCRREKATLVVAKLDRLSRNVAFLATLMESKVEFIAVDNPHATKFQVHILAAVAEWERDQISARTRAALAAAKARGVRLGKYGRVLARRNHKRAMQRAAQLKPLIREMRERGLSSAKIVAELNERGVPTTRGKR